MLHFFPCNYYSYVLLQDLYTMSGLMIMLEYLTDTAVSPLQRDFVEIDDPYCSKVSTVQD